MINFFTNYHEHAIINKLFRMLSRIISYQDYLQQLNHNKLFYQLLTSKLKNIIKYFFIKK